MSVIRNYLFENLDESFWSGIKKAKEAWDSSRADKKETRTTKRGIPFIRKKETETTVTPGSNKKRAALDAAIAFGQQRESDKKWKSRKEFAKKAAPYAAGAAALAGAAHYYNKKKDPCRNLEGEALEKCRLIRASKYEKAR